jgi:ATP-binding cassette, subfamily B, multidrug efflux pump
MSDPITPDENVSDRYLFGMLGRFLAPFWFQLLLVFLLLVVVTVLTLALPYLIQLAVDGPITEGNISGLIPYGIAYFLAIVALFGARFGHTYLVQNVGQSALVNIRQTLFEHILKQDMRFFNKTPVGLLVSRLSNDIDALTELLSTSIVIVASNLVTLVGIIIVMFLINWRLALLGLSVMPIMTIATIFYRVRIRRASSEFHKVVGEYLAFINEQFNGMLIIQLFGRQQVSREGLHAVNQRYRRVHVSLRDNYTAYAAILQIMSTVGFAIVLYGGGQGVLAGWATLGMLIAFIDYTRRSFEPILQLSEQFSQIQTAFAAGERIARMLHVQSEIDEPEQPAQVEWVERSFKFDHVNFGYEPEQLVLRDVDFYVPSGQRVAIVGATGAGKTSLAGLLARFYDVNDGCVEIDGVDVRELSLADLRRYVTVVPQNPYCFNGTVADNLRLFDPNVTYEQMKAAAHTACADKFIDKLPGGYDFELLPGGGNLSQGQRQLLALARALLHNPDSILVLDEATSSIDTETEAYIQEGLKRVLEQRTSLVIAHRLSTIREVDRILVMQRGQVIEDGTHLQLLKNNGVYAQLYRRQFEEIATEPSAEEKAV